MIADSADRAETGAGSAGRWQHSQQLGLGFQIAFADFVQKQRATGGRLERARPISIQSSTRAFDKHVGRLDMLRSDAVAETPSLPTKLGIAKKDTPRARDEPGHQRHSICGDRFRQRRRRRQRQPAWKPRTLPSLLPDLKIQYARNINRPRVIRLSKETSL